MREVPDIALRCRPRTQGPRSSLTPRFPGWVEVGAVGGHERFRAGGKRGMGVGAVGVREDAVVCHLNRRKIVSTG